MIIESFKQISFEVKFLQLNSHPNIHRQAENTDHRQGQIKQRELDSPHRVRRPAASALSGIKGLFRSPFARAAPGIACVRVRVFMYVCVRISVYLCVCLFVCECACACVRPRMCHGSNLGRKMQTHRGQCHWCTKLIFAAGNVLRFMF